MYKTSSSPKNPPFWHLRSEKYGNTFYHTDVEYRDLDNHICIMNRCTTSSNKSFSQRSQLTEKSTAQPKITRSRVIYSHTNTPSMLTESYIAPPNIKYGTENEYEATWKVILNSVAYQTHSPKTGPKIHELINPLY